MKHKGPALSVQIFSISCSFRHKFCKIIGWCTPLGCAPFGNPGSATVYCPSVQNKEITKRMLHKNNQAFCKLVFTSSLIRFYT